MFWIAPSVETGDHYDPLLFHDKEEPVREPTHSSPPSSVFQYRIMHRGGGDCLDSIHHCFREPLRKFRADAFVPEECVLIGSRPSGRAAVDSRSYCRKTRLPYTKRTDYAALRLRAAIRAINLQS